MKGLEKIKGLTDDQVKLLKTSAQNYVRFSRIYIEVVKVKKEVIYVKITDRNEDESKVLTADELKDRVIEAFKDCLPKGKTLHITPIPLMANYDFVNEAWIDSKLEEFGMTKIDLAHSLGLKHQNLYRLINGPRSLTNWHQAAIYFYFENLHQ